MSPGVFIALCCLSGLAALAAFAWAVVIGIAEVLTFEAKMAPAVKAAHDSWHDIRWPESLLPLEVVMSPGLPTRYQRLLGPAIEEVNTVVELFESPVPADEALRAGVETAGFTPPRGTVYVMGDSGLEPYHGLTTVYRLPSGEAWSAIIQVPDAHANSLLAPGVMLHEVCHAAGLGHDSTDTGSVMYPVAQHRPQRITEKDAEHLRRLYTKGI